MHVYNLCVCSHWCYDMHMCALEGNEFKLQLELNKLQKSTVWELWWLGVPSTQQWGQSTHAQGLPLNTLNILN